LENDPARADLTQIKPGADDSAHPSGVASPTPEDEKRLMDLASSIKRIEEYLIIRDSDKPIQDAWPFSEGSSSFYLWLKETYRRRSLRRRSFNPEYFSGEAAWDVLLDLAAAKIEGKRISVTSACIASGVPPTTALRWIALLEQDGMIIREDDYTDRRRVFVRISNIGMNSINSYYNTVHSYFSIPRRKL
jgi:hypothetical protein